MRVMVFLIGGGGFVGSVFTRACEAAGRDFVVLTRGYIFRHIGEACDVSPPAEVYPNCSSPATTHEDQVLNPAGAKDHLIGSYCA